MDRDYPSRVDRFCPWDGVGSIRTRQGTDTVFPCRWISSVYGHLIDTASWKISQSTRSLVRLKHKRLLRNGPWHHRERPFTEVFRNWWERIWRYWAVSSLQLTLCQSTSSGTFVHRISWIHTSTTILYCLLIAGTETTLENQAIKRRETLLKADVELRVNIIWHYVSFHFTSVSLDFKFHKIAKQIWTREKIFDDQGSRDF